MNMHLKKLLALFMPVSLTLAVLTACGSNSDQGKQENEQGSSAENTALALSPELKTEEYSSAVSAEQSSETHITSHENEIVIPELLLDAQKLPDTDGLRFTRRLKIGWNLGNTFDAIWDGGYSENELSLESAWVGVKTTKELIQSVKEAGFETLRLPVSWHNHLTDEEFTISQAWLTRVQEVVDYAIENDMYVILNTHHDVDTAYYYPTKEYLDSSKKYISSIWSQLARHFSNYDEHLIFESMNEPRMVGTSYEWWLDMNQTQCQEAVNCINQLNQTFVDTVRSSGGNNTTRYLMVPAYSAAPENAANEAFILPEDTTQGRLIVSVHAYKPYNFALQGPEENESVSTFDLTSSKSTGEIESYLDMVYQRFVANGIPVVIGEFGARDKNGNLQDRVDMTSYFTAYATARGIPCIWWDNNAFTGNGENFGLLDRRSNTWRYPEIVEAMMKYAFPL